MNTIEAISKRQSCRMYTDEQISDKELDIILRAANAAPVSMGIYQDVKLSVVQNKELIAKMEANTKAVLGNVGEHPTYGAPTVILVSGKNQEEKTIGIPFCNASCVAENIMLAATELGLGSVFILAVPLTMRYNTELCKEAMVPEGFSPVVVISVGKPAKKLAARELTLTNIKTDYIR